MQLNEMRLMPGKVLLDMAACQEKTVLVMKMVDTLKHRGLVVKVGEAGFDKKGRRFPIPVAVGDKVTFTPRVGTDIIIGEGDDAKQYRLINATDIIAVFENDEPSAG